MTSEPGRRPRRGQPRRLRGAGEHREEARAQGRTPRCHLRHVAACLGALGPSQRRQGNCASGVRGGVPGGGDRRGRCHRGKVVTGSGLAAAMEFALALMEQLYGKDEVDQVAKPTVLIPLANGSEEMEALTIVDALRRANADVVVASAEDGVEVIGRYSMRVVADALLDAAATDQQFDLIVVPGSNPGASTFFWIYFRI
ncbi:unnamed protein product [Urochloa humidicola]